LFSILLQREDDTSSHIHVKAEKAVLEAPSDNL